MTRETRLRRKAGRQGLTLRKSDSHDPDAPSFGSYWLVAANVNSLVLGGEWGVDLDAVEEFLTGEEDDRVDGESETP